jgi:hypothetical protein
VGKPPRDGDLPVTLPLTATRLVYEGALVREEPAGDLLALAAAFLDGRGGPAGLVVLGAFGFGKSTLCNQLAASRPWVTVVPLRSVAEHADARAGLVAVVGTTRLAEAREGRRVLLLDGLDEVPDPGPTGFQGFFDALVAEVGPRFVLTSRPGHVRHDASARPDGDGHGQVDVWSDRGGVDVDLVRIDPIASDVARAVVEALPRGRELWRSVEGLADLSASPLLLNVIAAAAPFVDPGRPIQAWGVFDAWLRFALDTGDGHHDALARLTELAWSAFADGSFLPRAPSLPADRVHRARLPAALRRTLFVRELDGRMRFGHRSVYEYLLACTIGPRLVANQGHGPDQLTGLLLTDATRAFLVGRTPMPTRWSGDRTWIPAGNFVAGGELSSDERPLRIAHLERPVWVSRVPVTHRDWARYLDQHPDDRVDAGYLAHWGPTRQPPEALLDAPVFGVWPDDADRYARAVGARLPTADEWEKAVRGLDGRRYPWGDWWRPGFAATAELGLDRPLRVRALGCHGDAGLFDAAGGVFEVTSSWWRGREDRGRVVMGGCFTHPASTARASLRLSHRLSGHLKVGLRLAWDG